MPRTWRAAPPSTASTIAGAVSVDMKRVKARKDDVVAAVDHAASRDRLQKLENCTVYRGSCAASRRRARCRSAARSLTRRADLHQRRWPAARPADPRPRPGRVPHQQLDDGRRLPAAAPGDRGRQLCRPRVRPDVPALRQRGHDRRDGAAPGPARGRGRLGGDRGDSWSARASTFASARSACSVSSASDDIAVRRRLRRGCARGQRDRICCSRRDGGPTPTISACERAGVEQDERGYIVVDDELRTNVPGHLGARRLQRHGAPSPTPSYNDFEIVAANLLDGERRACERPHPRLRALYRSAAGPGRDDRGGGARTSGRALLVGKIAHGRMCPAPSRRARPQGFMKILVDADTQEILGAVVPRHRRRRGHPLRARRHVRQGALHRAAARHAHPSDRLGVHSDDAGRARAANGAGVTEIRGRIGVPACPGTCNTSRIGQRHFAHPSCANSTSARSSPC